MKKRFLTAAAIGLALSVPAWSSAGADEGWYVSASVGYGGPGDSDVDLQASGAREINGESDWRQALAFGYDYANGWRLEAEAAHRYNDTGAIGSFEDSSSDFHIWSAMLNLYRDFNPDGWYHPYLGAGAGFGQVNGSMTGWTTGSRPVPNGGVADTRYVVSRDDDIGFMWQLIAGVGWGLGDNWYFDTQYRYFSTLDLDFDPGVDVDALRGHEVWLGLRYVFAAPPPPACDDVGFVVYFEWDRSNLTDQARAVINQAVQQASTCGVAAVQIDGHADRSGAAAYNVGLSERRARAVRDEMVRLGVPASGISLQAFGESRPAVQTPDGVREPLNRRAEVLIDLR